MDYAGSTNAKLTEPVRQDTLSYQINAIENLIGRLSKVASSAECIADAMQGVRPEKEQGGRPMPVPNGMTERLAALAENFEGHLNRADSAIVRTQNALG